MPGNSYAAILKKERREWGVCTDCGKARPAENHVRCAECLYKDQIRAINRPQMDAQQRKHLAEIRKALRDKRRAAGLCIMCGKEAYKAYTRCYECIARNRRNAAEFRRRRRAAQPPKEPRIYTPPPPPNPGKEHPWNMDNKIVFRKRNA